MNILFNIILIVLAIALTLYHLFQGRKVIRECRCGNKIVIGLLFFGCGLIAFLKYGDILSMITLAILAICGGLYSVIPSGFAKDGFIILGKFFPYGDCDEIKIASSAKRVEISFRYKRGVRFLFGELSERKELENLIRKVRSEGKL